MGSDASARTVDRRRERNRDEILAAARTLIVEAGPDALSLREVARRSGYSPAALYRYFSGKDALVAALGTESVAVLGRYMEEVPRDVPPAERLVALCEAYVCFAAEQPEWFALFGRLRLPPTDWEHYVRVAYPFTLVIEAVEDGMDRGEFEPGDADAAALGLWATAHGLASLRAGHLHDVTADHDALRRAAFTAHVRGLTREADR